MGDARLDITIAEAAAAGNLRRVRYILEGMRESDKQTMSLKVLNYALECIAHYDTKEGTETKNFLKHMGTMMRIPVTSHIYSHNSNEAIYGLM